MALTGIQIFKMLPKKNCKECGSPTCMAFAMKVAQGAVEITKCPHVSDEALAALSEATAPPMKSIKVGTGENEYTLGGETVLYRHEKTYVSKTRYAVSLCNCMDDAAVDAKIAEIGKVDYERIGERMHVEMVYVNYCAESGADKYLDIVKAEAAEAERSNIANITMNDFSLEVVNRMNDTSITIKTVMPDSGWSTNNKDMMVENEDPDAFGAGAIWFQLKDSLERLDFYKDSFKNYQEGEDRVIGGITFKCRTYERIGYDWIEYVAQIDDNRALSIGLTDLDCFEGTVPDIILNSMTFQ